MRDGASSPAGPPLPPPGEAGQPALIEGLACFDEWDALALARLPMRDLLRKAMRWRRARAGLA
jgi:hypothetical protein